MNQPQSPATAKYLNHYAEPESQLLAAHLQHWPSACQYQYALLIPAYREAPEFIGELAKSALRTQSVLLILIINQPDTDRLPDPQNRRLLTRVSELAPECWRHDQLHLHTLDDSAILIVDRFSQNPLPARQGVGLARKIGADLALTLIEQRRIEQPWIYSSDADATLPDGYFQALQGLAPAAATYPFAHRCDDDPLGHATRLYEQRLYHYVDGLRGAGSPYAYHSLGSALAIHAQIYAQVRGFPKRSGGEDFYLLNKAAKIAPPHQLPSPCIQIAARDSARAPFGTGPAVAEILANGPLEQQTLFYHPQIFQLLGQWLACLPQTHTRDIATLDLPANTRLVLEQLNAQRAIDKLRANSTGAQAYTRNLQHWFDAFRTLRFVHLLRDLGLANISLAARNNWLGKR